MISYTNFQNNCSTEYHWTHVTQNNIKVRMYNKSHKINLSGPFGHFVWRYPTISYLRPLFKQIEIVFSGVLTVYFNCKNFSIYTSELLGCLLGISPSGPNPCSRNNYYSFKIFLRFWIDTQPHPTIVKLFKHTRAFNTYCSPRNSSRDNLFWDLSWASLWQQNRSITTCSTYRTKYFSQYEQRVGRSKGVVRSKFYRLRK